jgi:hypothetical protein
MKDLHNNIEVTALLDPIAVSTTQTITDIDLAGYNSCEIVFHVGVDGSGLDGSNKIVWVMSDSPNGTDWTAVETADMLGVTVTSGIILTLDATSEDNAVYHFGYVGGQRYIQLVGTVTGTISLPTGIILIKGHMLDAPVIS